jgi:hypothetical protein
MYMMEVFYNTRIQWINASKELLKISQNKRARLAEKRSLVNSFEMV